MLKIYSLDNEHIPLGVGIDLSNITTSSQMSDILGEEFATQTAVALAEAENIYADTVWKSGHNCSILRTVGGMVSEASETFMEAMRAISGNVENAISDVIRLVGQALRGVKEAIADALSKVESVVQWVSDQADAVVSQVKDVMGQLLDGVNEVLYTCANALNIVRDSISEIMSEMAQSVKNLNIRYCDSLSDAVADVGEGVGLDRIYPATLESDSEFVERNLSGMSSLLPEKHGQIRNVANSLESAIRNMDQRIYEPLRGMDNMMGRIIT